MMHLAVSEDDMVKAESLVARVGKDYADSAMFAVGEGDSALVARLLGEAPDVHVGLLINAVWQVGEWLEQPAIAERFARAAAARPDRPTRANIELGENLVGQGRWTAADSAFRRAVAATTTDGVPRLNRGLVAAMPFLSVPRPTVEAIQADLTAWDPAAGSASRPFEGQVPGMLPAARL